jgi:thioredoxin:protein disulfide reductase
MKFIGKIIILMLISLTSLAQDSIALDKIFQLRYKVYDANGITLSFKIADNFLLYANKLTVKELDGHNLELGAIKTQSHAVKHGKNFVYEKQLILYLPIASKQAGEYLLEFNYQGCNKHDYCYPPIVKTFILSFDEKLALKSLMQEKVEQIVHKNRVTPSLRDRDSSHPEHSQGYPALQDATPRYAPQDKGVLSLWMSVLKFFIAGLLLSLTPCLLPMLPILSSILLAKNTNKKRRFSLALSYVIGMSLMYAFLGGIIAAFGHNLQLSLQSPAIIISSSMICAALALFMLDVYSINLPSNLAHKLFAISRQKPGLLGAALMGAAAILLISPCVTPALIAALAYITEQDQVFLGMINLFCLSFGMGIPLLALSISLEKFVPKTGVWMQYLKILMGSALLAVAVNLVNKVLATNYAMLTWAIFFLYISYKIYKDKLKFYKHLSVTVLLSGLALSYIYNKNSILTNNKGTTATAGNLDQFHAAMQKIDNSKPIIIDVYASWCNTCQEIETKIFHNNKILTRLKGFNLIRIDLSEPEDDYQDLLDKFAIVGPPTIIMLNNKLEPCERLIGKDAASELQFMQSLGKCAS